MVKSMLSHVPDERPETTDVLSMEFITGDSTNKTDNIDFGAGGETNESVSQFRRQRRKTTSTESEE